MDREYVQGEPAVQETFTRGFHPALALRSHLGQKQFPYSGQDTALIPQPISTAPQEEDRALLLFCPEQGGWHTGIWFLGKWLAYIDTSVVLRPSYWLPVPDEPPAEE
jgi:hypothetical protein